MARTSLVDVQSIQDPLITSNWDFQILQLPGSNLSRELTIRCTSTSIPSSSVGQVELEAHGVKLYFAGKRTWTGTWTATFFESRNNNTRDAFVNWAELMRSWESNTGSYSSVYKTQAHVVLYDDLPKVVKTIVLMGVFPTEVGEITLDQNAAVVSYSVTFSFDYTSDR